MANGHSRRPSRLTPFEFNHHAGPSIPLISPNSPVCLRPHSRLPRGKMGVSIALFIPEPFKKPITHGLASSDSLVLGQRGHTLRRGSESSASLPACIANLLADRREAVLQQPAENVTGQSISTLGIASTIYPRTLGGDDATAFLAH